jgi:hypothetical protein
MVNMRDQVPIEIKLPNGLTLKSYAVVTEIFKFKDGTKGITYTIPLMTIKLQAEKPVKEYSEQPEVGSFMGIFNDLTLKEPLTNIVR